jgi:hypothetical protein
LLSDQLADPAEQRRSIGYGLRHFVLGDPSLPATELVLACPRAASTSPATAKVGTKIGTTAMSSTATGIKKTAPSGRRTDARVKATTDPRTASRIFMTVLTSNYLA